MGLVARENLEVHFIRGSDLSTGSFVRVFVLSINSSRVFPGPVTNNAEQWRRESRDVSRRDLGRWNARTSKRKETERIAGLTRTRLHLRRSKAER